MPSKSLKALYIAKSWEELKKRAEDVNSSIKITSNIQNIIKSADSLYIAAKEADVAGDEERCYILFFRYFEVITNLKKSPNYEKEKEFCRKMIGVSKAKEAMDCLEQLTSSLKKRYSALKESQDLRAKEIAESSDKQSDNKNLCNQVINGSKQLEVSDSLYPLIECQTLVEELENKSEMTRISIFDIRTANDFNDSHIDRIKTTADLCVVHLPPDLLTAGLTASILEKTLPLGNTRDVFYRRRTMSKIIILDYFSQELIASTPAYILAEALWKWDSSSLKVKSKPMLLRGGYDEWVITYPMFTTNPNYIPKANNISSSKRQLNLAFNYELALLENEPKKVENHVNNCLTNGQIKDEDQDLDDSEVKSRLTDMFQRPSKAAVPGTAQFASYMPSIPDRSTKPIIQTEKKSFIEKTNEKNEDFEKIRLRKQNESTEVMLSIVKNEYNENMQTLSERLKQKDEENAKLKTTLRKLLPEKPSNVQNNDKIVENSNNISNGDTNSDDKRNGIYVTINEKEENKENDETNEHHIRNSISMNGDIRNQTSNQTTTPPKNIVRSANNLSVNSNLSRSLSSPNIAQLIEKEKFEIYSEDTNRDDWKERSLTTQPQFDRTLKPAFNRVSFNDNKVRDFCPVHSAGSSITGLRNLGNTCFMNAVIQCLLNTNDFSTFFTNGVFHINKNSKFGSNGELVMELAALFRAMAYPSSYKSISPKDFKQAVSKHIQGFIGCSQQDSHEFLVMLIEKLHADLNESTARDVIDTSVPEDLSLNAAANKFWKEHLNKNNSIITKLFEGLIVNTLKCLTCHKTSNTFEVFRCLSVPISTNRNRPTLNECLEQFLKPERLSGEAAWECPTCKTKREADKKVNIWKLPKLLIVHLKRFLYEGVWRQKNQTYVEFPIDELSIASSKYSLYGVVNHYGTLEGGHYTAFSTNRNKYKWHRFDDQEITQMNSLDVKTQAAYILFYKCW